MNTNPSPNEDTPITTYCRCLQRANAVVCILLFSEKNEIIKVISISPLLKQWRPLHHFPSNELKSADYSTIVQEEKGIFFWNYLQLST